MPPARRAHSVLGPAGVAASFAARGLHSVLLPWMLIAAAPASALSIGGIQGAALGAQALALAALGGLGDRLGARRVAVAGQLGAAVPALALALAGPDASLPLLAAYALTSGAIWGLLSPARDALAARDASGDLLRPTAGFTAAQFAGLLAGIALASRAEAEGARMLLVAQAALHLAAAAALVRPERCAPAPAPSSGGTRSGASAVRETIALSALFGSCSAGPFAVWAPLLAAEAGGAAAPALALLFALFPLGTIAASLALRRAALPCDKRSAMLAAHAAASLALGAASATPSFPAVIAGFALWGFCGGVFMTCGRARLLESRPAGGHARVLATLQLALLAASAAGAALAGLVSARFGARASIAVCAAAALLGVAAVAGVRRARVLAPPAGPATEMAARSAAGPANRG